MPFSIIRNDITLLEVDAIVNAANPNLEIGGGVCGAIFRAAGACDLQAACEPLAPVETGEIVITPAFALSAKYIIHTVGPIYRGGFQGEAQLLHACYRNSLAAASQAHCASIAFPLLSSGKYGYPKEEALQIGISAIREFLTQREMDIHLVIFDKESFSAGKKLIGQIESYIDQHYVDQQLLRRRGIKLKEYPLAHPMPAAAGASLTAQLNNLLGNLDEPFAQTLLRMIDAKGKTDIEIYKRANIDRRLFSKIRTGKGYMPSKRTVIALAIALELPLTQAEYLLKCAGYALSHSHKGDVIVEYFIVNQKYDIFEINQVLFHYDQPLLGG